MSDPPTTTAATGQPLSIKENDLAALGGPITNEEYANTHLKGLSVEELLDRLPMYAQIIGHKWPEGTSKEVLHAWVFGATQASDEIKDIITRWRAVNAKA